MLRAEVETLLRCYPQIYFPCHRRHVRDDKTGEVMSQHQASVLDHLDDTAGTALFDLAPDMGGAAATMSLTLGPVAGGGGGRGGRRREGARPAGKRAPPRPAP